ncbi:homing endonuclease associated repeat-containing protein [Halosimplex amylolyticum]|uniref:homing endonuclease associated repeat-containing protein n=1 Tax=Halosimplex amylolyticum TaxID=3396616 RepID=UPI003F562B22
MEQEKSENVSQGSKSSPEEMRSKAQGTIPKAAFTNGEAGLFSKKHLSGRSIYERLQKDEVAHFLLVNKSDGIIIYTADGTASESMTAGSNYRSIMAVTDRRIVFAFGGDEDTILDITAEDVTGAEFQSSLLKKYVTVSTEPKRYKFAVSIEESSDPEDTVEYIQDKLVPKTSVSEESVESDSSFTTEVESQALGSWFLAHTTLPSQDTRNVLEEVTERLETVDPSTDPLQDAIEEYKYAKQTLERNANEAGVSTEAVTEELNNIEHRLETLSRIHAVKVEVSRKLVLMENGMQVPEPKLQDLQSSIDASISDAESFDRSTTELEKYREQVTHHLDKATSRKTAEAGPGSVDESGTAPKSANDEGSTQNSQGDSSADSGSTSSRTTTDHEEGTQVEAKATREAVIDAIEQVSEQLEKRPTTLEFETHSSLNSSDAYRHFESWGDALDAASLDTVSREELLDELHRVSTELGFLPLSSHVDEHSQFSAYDYRQVFGSVTEALEEAGPSIQDRVRATLRKVVTETDGDPKMAEFEAASDYSAGVIYKFFDSWDDAVSAVSPTETSSTREEQKLSKGTATVAQNELSEWYELVRYLNNLCTAILDVRQNQLNGEDMDDPMVQWAAKVAEFWQGEAVQNEGYGTQQAERNSFSMQEYREMFGDGNWVTRFECVQTRQPNPTMRALYGTLLDDGPSEIYLPVDTQTGDIFPVIVDTEEELDRAVKMLDRLPTKPASAETDTSEEPRDERVDEDSPDTTPSSGDLEDVNGITDEIAQSLCGSGYDTHAALKMASLEDVADVDGVSEQVAMRIKLDVGG